MARTPYVNASLMHEIRMIAMVALPALIPVVKKLMDSKPGAGLRCEVCFTTRAETTKAVAISRGFSVCEKHLVNRPI